MQYHLLTRKTETSRYPEMSDMSNPSRSLNPKAEALHEPILQRTLRRIGSLMGLGLLDPKIMWYALGTFICGLGAGLSIDALVRTRQAPADWLAWSGIGLVVLGNVVGNVSHSFLKKAARRKLGPDATRHEEEAS
jgi:hypothetical protein